MQLAALLIPCWTESSFPCLCHTFYITTNSEIFALAKYFPYFRKGILDLQNLHQGHIRKETPLSQWDPGFSSDTKHFSASCHHPSHFPARKREISDKRFLIFYNVAWIFIFTVRGDGIEKTEGKWYMFQESVHFPNVIPLLLMELHSHQYTPRSCTLHFEKLQIFALPHWWVYQVSLRPDLTEYVRLGKRQSSTCRYFWVR